MSSFSRLLLTIAGLWCNTVSASFCSAVFSGLGRLLGFSWTGACLGGGGLRAVSCFGGGGLGSRGWAGFWKCYREKKKDLNYVYYILLHRWKLTHSTYSNSWGALCFCRDALYKVPTQLHRKAPYQRKIVCPFKTKVQSLLLHTLIRKNWYINMVKTDSHCWQKSPKLELNV